LSYYKGEPVCSDAQWKKLKEKVLVDGKRSDVTAFLLYSKGQELLDAETFAEMQQEMQKLGVTVQRAGTKAIESTLTISSDRLENNTGQVAYMMAALGALPVILCTAIAWSIGLFLDWEFVPQPDWGALLSAEVVPLFGIGFLGGVLLLNQILIFLDLQNPRILTGTCPSCAEDSIKLFSGGADPQAKVNYACPSCGCKMVLDTEASRICSAGTSAQVDDGDGFDWGSAWQNVKNEAKKLVSTA